MTARTRRAEVYRYRARWPLPEYLPQWGTLEAIATIDGSIPMRPTRRMVDATLLDPDGFMPYQLGPDDLR